MTIQTVALFKGNFGTSSKLEISRIDFALVAFKILLCPGIYEASSSNISSNDLFSDRK